MKIERRSAFGWGAVNAPAADLRHGIVVHYDGTDLGLAGKPHTACRAYWRAVRQFHIRATSKGGRGWRDIGYSYGLCPHGAVLEGRGWGVETAAQPGGNTTWTSITFMTGEHEDPSPEQLAAFRVFRAWARGRGVSAAIRGHRDFSSTACPGDRLYRMVRDGTLAGAPDWMEAMMEELPTLGRGDSGEHVETVQGLLLARSHGEVRITGVFDATTVAAVKAIQHWGGVDADGVVGPKTWPVLLRVAPGLSRRR